LRKNELIFNASVVRKIIIVILIYYSEKLHYRLYLMKTLLIDMRLMLRKYNRNNCVMTNDNDNQTM